MVTFPAGGLTAVSEILDVSAAPSGIAVVTASTPFHPLDPRWPDQGPDRGTLTVDGIDYPVIDVTYGATDGQTLYVGDEVPVRRGTSGWAFLVVHVLPAGDAPPALGATALLSVDTQYRRALSAGHTACHVATLALNVELADRLAQGPGRRRARFARLRRPGSDLVADRAGRRGRHLSPRKVVTQERVRHRGAGRGAARGCRRGEPSTGRVDCHRGSGTDRGRRAAPDRPAGVGLRLYPAARPAFRAAGRMSIRWPPSTR